MTIKGKFTIVSFSHRHNFLVLDSGATYYMGSYKNWFATYKQTIEIVYFCDDTPLVVEEIGN